MEMDLEKLCCYSERECNEPVAKNTGYCESHILSSRFAEELGYRQCAYKNNQKVSSIYYFLLQKSLWFYWSTGFHEAPSFGFCSPLFLAEKQEALPSASPEFWSAGCRLRLAWKERIQARV